MPEGQSPEGQSAVWKRWVGRVVAAVIWGACVYGLNALAVRFGPHVNIPVVIGWWSFAGYFMGTWHGS